MKVFKRRKSSLPGRLALASLPVAALLVLGGCSVLTPEPVRSDLTPSGIITGTAAVSHAVVLEPDEKIYICQQPQPDATFDAAGSEGFTFIDLSDKGGESASAVNAEQEMEGRTPGLMLARELFYRLCEFSFNHKLDQQQAIDLYRQNLTVIEKISEIQAGRTDIKIGQTLINKEVSSAPGQAVSAPIILPTDGRGQRAAITNPTSAVRTVTSSTLTPATSSTSSPTSSSSNSSSSSSSSTYKSPWAN